jgi:hypothetical protein
MGRESEEPSLPSLQHLILHGERKHGRTLSYPYNGLLPDRDPQVIRCTASMDVHQSPRRRTTLSSLFDLLNDDSGATNTITPPRAQRGPARNPRSCSPDETPLASDVSCFGSSTHFMPRNPVLGASPRPAGVLGGRQASIPAHPPLPPSVRRTSDPLSEAESSSSGYSKVEPATRRSLWTTSSASSVNDHELNFRPTTFPADLLVADEGQRLTQPDKRSLDSFFSRPTRRLPGPWRRRDRPAHPSLVQPRRVILIEVARCGAMRVIRPQRWWAARCPVRDARSPVLPVSTRLNNARGVLSLGRSGVRARPRATGVGMGARHRIVGFPPSALGDLRTLTMTRPSP